ncbi:Golgi apparatus membrane protein tvp23 [Microbotryomycetes sp. JL221]|nr:Golgi apparatus membrane protein tvp23 [Microbotryomycetes sp. JL221]
MAYNPSSSSTNLLSSTNLSGQITADDDSISAAEQGFAPQSQQQRQQQQIPTSLGSIQTQGQGGVNSSNEASILSQSAHPVALVCLYLFRSLAIATYLLCGFFSSSYVFSTVLVVVLLSLDFWTVRNVSGRILCGLRFWNQVDEDGSSYWVFEHRSPDQPSNAVDQKMFWIAMYAFPAAWVVLLFVGLLKFNISFLPIVMLALVFNMINTIGYTYADRDAKRKWAAESAATGMMQGFGGFGTSLVTGMASKAVGSFFK